MSRKHNQRVPTWKPDRKPHQRFVRWSPYKHPDSRIEFVWVGEKDHWRSEYTIILNHLHEDDRLFLLKALMTDDEKKSMLAGQPLGKEPSND